MATLVVLDQYFYRDDFDVYKNITEEKVKTADQHLPVLLQ